MSRTMTSTGESSHQALPREIRRVLGQLDRRIRAVAALKGLGTVALVVALIAAAGMALDFAWPLPQSVRWLIWGAWLLVGGWAVGTRVVRPLFRGRLPLELAAVAERTHPGLGERLTGAVGLLGETGRPHGSSSLIAAVADDASQHAVEVDPRQAVSFRNGGRRLALGMFALGLVIAPALIWPDTVGRLGRRFLIPWGDISRVSRYVVTVSPGDRVVALGDDLTIQAKIEDRYGRLTSLDNPWVEWTDPQGASHRVAMETAQPDSPSNQKVAWGYTAVLPRVMGSFSYRVVSGPAESKKFRVKAVEPPRVASVEAKVEPPAYTEFPSYVARDSARVEVWEGSRITLNIQASRPANAIEVEWPKMKEPVAATLAKDRRSGSMVLNAETSGAFSLRLRDELGLASRPETPRRLVVKPDSPPVISTRGSEKAEESRPDDTLRVAVATRDDIAVASVELHYAIERAKGGSASKEQESGHVTSALKGLGTSAARGILDLPLKSLGLRPGDTLSYRVRVADNRPEPRGPNVVWSSTRMLAIVAETETLQARQNRLDREALQAKLDAVKAAASENRKETEQLRYAADAVQRGNGSWEQHQQRDLEQREVEARAVGDRLQALSRELAADTKFRSLARPARQIAEVEAEGGRAMLEKARGQENATQRLNDLRQADARLAAVSQRLDDLQRQFDALTRRDADMQRLGNLAEREAEIAKNAAEKAADRAQLDRLQAEQAAVRNDLDNLLKSSPELRADVLTAQAGEADTLARRARELAARQREEARQATDLSTRKDALKALAEAQRALEDDARRLALEVDEPLAENWRGRVNIEAIRQAVEPIEQGDLDQARQRLEGAEQELRRLARDIEDVPNDPKALAARLARRQDELNGPIAEAIREVKDTPREPTVKQMTTMVEKLRPLAERQEAIARLAATIQPPRDPQTEAFKSFPQDQAKSAVQSANRASEALRALKPREIEQRQEEARRDLRRLADSLPDVYRRHEPARQRLGEAMRQTDEVGRELERHLRETAPEPGKTYDAAKAAESLAERLAPFAERQAKIAQEIGALEVEPRSLPQRDRAARRAQALAAALKTAGTKDAPLSRRQELRSLLPAARIEARASLERLEQKVHGRVPADDVAEELAADQRGISGDAKNPEGRAGEAADQRRLATALRALPVADAVIAQEDAVRAAERAAQALADPDPKRDPRAEVRAAMEAVGALADQLTDHQSPRAKAEALARAQRALEQTAANANPADVARRQRGIAEGLASLPQEGRDVAEEPLRLVAEMAERALQPDGDQPGSTRPSPAALAGARARAAEALDKLAAKLPAEPPKPGAGAPSAEPQLTDPELRLNGKSVEAARRLAQRERQVREQLQSLLGEKAEPQQALRQESTALARDLADLRDRTRSVSDRGQRPAHEAAQLLGEHAPRAMDQGVEQLVRAQPAPARDAQRRAAEMIERGAQQAEDLAAALRSEVAAAAGARPKGEPPASAPLGEAREAMRQATRQLDQARDPEQGRQAARSAQEAMANAARALRQAAAQQAGEPGNEGDLASRDEPSPDGPHGPTLDPKSAAAGTAQADLEELKSLIKAKSGRSWGELPGHLRSEILQMSQGRYRDDYARLIQLYFRELASGSEKPQ